MVHYFPLFLLAVGQLSFLAKLLEKEPGSKISTVGKVAHHVHQDPADDQPEGSAAAQQEGADGLGGRQQESLGEQEEGHGAGQEGPGDWQQEGLGAGQGEGNLRRHPRNISIPRLPPHSSENPLAQRIEELVERYEEVSKSLMPAVTRARQVIREDNSNINFRDATIRLFFLLSFLFELLGIATDLNRSPSTIFWKLMGQGNFFVLFAWPHIHTEVFGVDAIPLPCSEQDANRTLQQMRIFQPENVGQLAVSVENARVELEVALQCVLARGHKFAEAAEVGLLLNQLLQLYNDKLQLQVSAPPTIPDTSSLSYIDQDLMKYRSSLPGLSGQTSSDAIHSISSKNHIISEGLAFGGVALFSTLVEQMKDQDHVKGSREDHLKTETNEAKWKNILRFISKGAGAGALTKAGVAYKSLLAIQYENPDVIDCGADDMRRALALFPLLETPADILISAGNKRRAKQMVVDLGAAIRRNLHCLYFRPQAFALLANVNAYLDLLNIRIELS